MTFAITFVTPACPSLLDRPVPFKTSDRWPTLEEASLWLTPIALSLVRSIAPLPLFIATAYRSTFGISEAKLMSWPVVTVETSFPRCLLLPSLTRVVNTTSDTKAATVTLSTGLPAFETFMLSLLEERTPPT